MTEIERPVLTAMFNPAVYPENLRDAAAVDAAETDLQHPLVALDGAVSRSACPDRRRFHRVADLNVAAILS
jgi:hypothetical protein